MQLSILNLCIHLALPPNPELYLPPPNNFIGKFRV